MKKIFLLSVIASMFLFGCGPDDDTSTTPKGESGAASLTVDQTQRSVLWYWTATWCGPCGLSGSPLFKQMMSENEGNNLVAIDLHSSNSSRLVPGFINPSDNAPTVTPSAGLIAQSIRPNGYIPLFTLNNEFQGNSSVNVNSVNDKIIAHNADNAPIGVAASASASGNTITVKTKTKFFDEANGDYHISVLLLEKEVIAPQLVGSTEDLNFKHYQVFRAAVVGESLSTQEGISFDPIASGTIVANTEVDGEYTLDYEKAQLPEGFSTWEYDRANTSVVVVIWKKNGQIYDTVNSIEVDL